MRFLCARVACERTKRQFLFYNEDADDHFIGVKSVITKKNANRLKKRRRIRPILCVLVSKNLAKKRTEARVRVFSRSLDSRAYLRAAARATHAAAADRAAAPGA